MYSMRKISVIRVRSNIIPCVMKVFIYMYTFLV